MSDALLWNEIGTIYLKLGQLDESVQAYLKSIEISPDSALVYGNLASSYFQKKEYERAIALYRKSISLLKTPQEQSTAWNRIGDAYRALRDLDKAIAAYRKADELEMEPITYSAGVIQGACDSQTEGTAHLFSDENYDPSIPARGSGEPDLKSPLPTPPPANTAAVPSNTPIVEPEQIASSQNQAESQSQGEPLHQDQNKPRFVSSIGSSSLEEVLAKVNIYEKITQANPTNHRAWDTLGKLYKSIGRYQDGISAYKHALENAPQNEHYYYHLGLLFTIEQKQENAIWAFENVLCINPDHTLAYSALAGIYRRLGMEAKANQHIAAALPKMDDESAYNRACFYAICGDLELSIEFLRLALQNNDTSIEWIKTDPDLQSVRNDDRYHQLVAQFESPTQDTAGENYFSSELDSATNRLLPVLNYSIAR